MTTYSGKIKETQIIPMYKNSNSNFEKKSTGTVGRPYNQLDTKENRLRSNKFLSAVAGMSLLVSGYLIGQCDSKNESVELVNGPKNAMLIDYAIMPNTEGKVTKITMLPNTKYDTLLQGNGTTTIIGNVQYEIDCKALANKNNCTDTRKCQLTFKTIDDKLKN